MNRSVILMLTVCSLFSISAVARDTPLHLSVDEAMTTAEFREKLADDVQFFFADQPYPVPTATMGEFITNKKTNAFGKSDKEACEWVFLSAMIALKDRALAEGGNAVVNIVSYYKQNEFASDSDYECHAGAIMSGVALKGRVVTLP